MSPPEVHGDANMRSTVRHALKWAAVGRFSGQFISWGVTIFVMRLLAPSDYGLMALAMTFVTFLFLFNEVGLGAAIINNREMTHGQLASAFGLILTLNLGLALSLALLAPLISLFFEEPRLTTIVRVLALLFVFAAFTTVPQALLERDMRFRATATIHFISTMVGSVFTLAFAWNGLGVWALVYGTIGMQIAKAICTNFMVHPFLPSFQFAGLGAFARYGANVAGTRILWFVSSHIDVLLIGKLLGNESLGYYSVAMQLASLPMTKVSSLMTQIAFPAFSRFKNEPQKVVQYLIKASRMTSMLAFPLLWGLSSVSPEAIDLVLGSKWLPAVLPLQILCLVIPIRMVASYKGPANMGTGRADISFTNVCISAVVMPFAFWIGSYWGLVGVSMAWIFGFVPVFIYTSHRTMTALGSSVLPYLGSMRHGIIGSAIMAAVVFVLRVSLSSSIPDMVSLAIFVGSGGAIYVAYLYLVNRDGMSEFLELARR